MKVRFAKVAKRDPIKEGQLAKGENGAGSVLVEGGC